MDREKERIMLLQSPITKFIGNDEEEIGFSYCLAGYRDEMAFFTASGPPGCSNLVESIAPVPQSSMDVMVHRTLRFETNLEKMFVHGVP